ncbi:MAG TPA: protein-methionine-sulfoxide reductase heme-binding subunit MsrQ, partial [Vicinamibacterales bacterium]|nr:protein-methionine-sulfoxide reductase heme-binding subunit MsrQ [Vicinamibacterales bacterium]
MPSAWRGLKTALAAIVNWRFFKPAVFIACGVELVWLSYDFYLVWSLTDTSALGVDPKKTLLHETGQTSLLILLAALSVTPFRRIFSINGIIRVRRMLGVWSFAYALAHLTIYLGFDQLCFSGAGCQWRDIWQDIGKRPFIFMGMLAFACLLLLAVTSTAGWVRRLKKNWARLHRLVYLAALAAIVHFVWIQKSDYSEPLRWAIWLFALLLFRVGWAIKRSGVISAGS